MKKYPDKIGIILFHVLIIIEILFVIIVSFRSHDNVSFANDSFYTINDHWSYLDDNGVEQYIKLPVVIDAGDDKTVFISRVLPTYIPNLSTLGILSSHQNIRAYLGPNLIYSRVSDSGDHFFDVPSGNLWDLIQLPPRSYGQVITLQINSEYNNNEVRINEIHAGTTAAILIHIINSFGLGLVLSIIILCNGLVLIVIYIFLRRLININKSILYLGLFSVLSAIWMIMESNLTQVFISNEYVISSLTYLSLMTFPIPLIFYVTLIDGFHYKKLLTWLNYVFMVSAYTLILLQVFNIMDFQNSLFLVRTEIFVIISIVFTALCLELFRHRNKDIKTFTISSGILFGFGFIELVSYKVQTENNTGTFFQIGFLIFTLLLAWSALKKVAAVIKLSETASHYKYLATRDPLTNCRSRVAYAKDLDLVDLNRNIVIFMADVNNMKQVNDSYGHHAGDEVIILCSQCLLEVFGRRVYRIGGDEFVCIEYDLSNEGIETMLTEFLIECDKANADIPYAFDVSVGYAFFDKTIDKNIYDTVQRADKNMYERKTKMKE